MRACGCVWVWDIDRIPTWEWLAIIRHSVTRGYVRQLELCFLTETWFMLLVVTVTTSKPDRKQTQTKGWRNQCWLNTAILLIPSACKQTSGYQQWRLMLIPKTSGVIELVHLYWWCLQGVVEAAGAVRGDSIGHTLPCSRQHLCCSAGGRGSCEHSYSIFSVTPAGKDWNQNNFWLLCS